MNTDMERIELSDNTREMLEMVKKLNKVFNMEMEATREAQEVRDVDIDFSLHLSQVCEDVMKLQSYNMMMKVM